MRFYSSNHPKTANYVKGMMALYANDFATALTCYEAEPTESPCYGLALANKALALLRLGRYSEAERSGKLALTDFETKGCPHPPTWIQTSRNLVESISLQGRHLEAADGLEEISLLTDRLAAQHSEYAEDCYLEYAHGLNSFGGALLKSNRADGAIALFTTARDIYRIYPSDTTGHAEVLTNLAQAYNAIDRKTDAAFALDEARKVAGTDHEQLERIDIASARLGLIAKAEAAKILKRVADAAANRGQFDTAYIRCCIAASTANEYRDADWGLAAIEQAARFETALDDDDLGPAKLCFYEATFLELKGQPATDVLRALLTGARLWCERLPGRFLFADYRDVVAIMHDHFRKLSAVLMSLDRHNEAFVAFEIGRCRAFALEITGDHSHPMLQVNPFQETRVDCDILTQLQARIKIDECIATLAIYPLSLTAFIVSKTELKMYSVRSVDNFEQAKIFRESIDAVAERLRHDKGIDSIPEQVKKLAESIRPELENRTLVLLAPHSILHKVPWRTLLHCEGIPWSQLPFITQFSPLLDLDRLHSETTVGTHAVALGNGTTGKKAEVSLNDEAREFSSIFGSNGRHVVNARKADVITSLKRNGIVLISCHGDIVETERKSQFIFTLADGSCTPEDMLEGGIMAELVLLSACSSGVYEMAVGDYPVGAAPDFLLAGARFCVCMRFPVNAIFAKQFFVVLGRLLVDGGPVGEAFVRAIEEVEAEGWDVWQHIGCLELLGRGF